MPADATDRLSAAERAAIKEHRAASRRSKTQSAEEGEREVLAKIAEMPEPDRAMAERVHTIVRAAAPHLLPRTWYGMPAYSKGGDVLCYFQPASKFKARYSVLGFSDKASLDDSDMWPVMFAIAKLTAETEAAMRSIVERAAS